MTKKFPKSKEIYAEHYLAEVDTPTVLEPIEVYLKKDIDEWKKQDDKKKEDLKKLCHEKISKYEDFVKLCNRYKKSYLKSGSLAVIDPVTREKMIEQRGKSILAKEILKRLES